MRSRLLLLMFVAMLPLLAQAQSKVTASTSIWPELQFSYGVGESGILFLQSQYRINTDGRYNDLSESGLLSGLERIELVAGYEHTLTEHWRLGAMYRYAIEDYPKTSFIGAFLRHNGNIKSLYFNKQVQYDHVLQEDQDAKGNFRAMAELGKRLPLKDKYITPAISYELMLLSDYKKDENTSADERTVDRTRLRLGLTYELTEQLRITPYFMRQTDYYYVQARFDEDMQVIEEASKRNRIVPIIGLEIKYSLNTTPNTASYTY
ncbi:DUF2490 domain-containing protein [Pontibacter ruber]|uniref:DUF2490 domain-containing protein n=1 Tax=Pontibacter ruber TaxID=1343895 RepID=A0ABW5CUN7_9BACT|nr:DUF2490 domain-containing protein [Pontibacter ruber]